MAKEEKQQPQQQQESHEKEPQTFEAILNPELDKAGYGFSRPILEADKENGQETEFMAGIPREVTSEEFEELSGELEGKEIVVKK